MLPNLRTYTVSASARQPLLDFIITGLEEAGCRILFNSDTRRAPFVITFETSAGERMGIVAYAFLATRTPTKNRPADERSFQIKYGSKQTDNLHELWRDPLGLYTTLLVGIDPNEGFFVSADPQMHNPTKFFIRLEFKDGHTDEIQRAGWYAWERERRSNSGLVEPIEVLVGGARNTFLDLVRFERAATGLSQGDRQLLSEKRELFSGRVLSGATQGSLNESVIHPIAREFQLSPEEILELIASTSRLKMAVRGWVAEEHLKNCLAVVPGVTSCERVTGEGSPDLRIRYKDGPTIAIECKNTLRKVDSNGHPRIDFQRTRASKIDPCSRYYASNDFDIVAGCLHAVTEKWEFKYVLAKDLPPHAKCPGKLASNVRIDSRWDQNPVPIFEAAYSCIDR